MDAKACKRRGRPPICQGEVPGRAHVRVAPHDYDRLHILATRLGVSVPEVIRRILRRRSDDGLST